MLTLSLHGDTEVFQHAFGMVTRGDRLDNRRFSLGQKPGQKNTAFDLGTGHGETVFDPLETYAAFDDERRAVPLSFGAQLRAHQAQRLHDTPHGTAGERIIAGQPRLKRLRREQTRHQAHRGS